MVPVAQFKLVSGTPKEISKTADSGKSITSCFCGDCGTYFGADKLWLQELMEQLGTTLFRYGDAFGGKDGMRIIKAGILDDINVINSIKPGAELYAPERIKWVGAVAEANQLDGMPS